MTHIYQGYRDKVGRKSSELLLKKRNVTLPRGDKFSVLHIPTMYMYLPTIY